MNTENPAARAWNWRSVLRRLISWTVFACVALVLSGLAIRLCGADALPALRVCLRGSVGTAFALGETLNHLLVLGLPALAVALSFRAGIFNIGADGQMLCGAAGAAAWSLLVLPAGTPWLLGVCSAVLAGALSGACWSLLAGVLKLWRGVNEVISTIMLNLIAQQGLKYLLSSETLLRSAKSIEPRSDTLPAGVRLVEAAGIPAHAGIILLPLAAVGLYFFLFHSRAGLCVRATGYNPIAARAAGMPVRATELGVFAGAGALCGLSGAVAVLALGYLPNTSTNPEAGFLAVAAALCAGLHPLGILPSAFFFSALQNGAQAMERSAHVPGEVLYLFEGLVILMLLARGMRLPGTKALSAGSAA